MTFHHRDRPEDFAERRDCECCDASGTVAATTRVERFPYGAGKDGVMLEARVPVWTCSACGDSYTEADAEDLRHEAVCVYLGRPTPAELKAFRAEHDLTQQALADLTEYGIASIKRWEGASQVPSASAAATLRRIMAGGIAQTFGPPKFRTQVREAALRHARTFQPSFGVMLPEAA